MTTLDLNTKTIMSHLLLGNAFHPFSLIEGEVTTFCRFSVDGRLHKEFFEKEQTRDFTRWEDVQEYFLAIIRGKRTPLSFKFVLSLAGTDIEAFLAGRGLALQPADVQGLYLNLRYDGNGLKCITGTSMNTFTMDKSLEQEWDAYVQEFFAKLNR